MKWPLLVLQSSKLFFIVLPFHYVVAYLIAYVLNGFDVNGKHPTGTGLIMKAWK